jgi:hypothetical protein
MDVATGKTKTSLEAGECFNVIFCDGRTETQVEHESSSKELRSDFLRLISFPQKHRITQLSNQLDDLAYR